MFLFGLLSTHIPYIILMGLYFIGFGIYSSNAIREKVLNDKEASSEKKEVQLDKIPTYTLNKEKDCLYTDYSFSKTDRLEKTDDITHKLLCFSNVLIFEKQEKIYSTTFFSYFFSRPPPFQIA